MPSLPVSPISPNFWLGRPQDMVSSVERAISAWSGGFVLGTTFSCPELRTNTAELVRGQPARPASCVARRTGCRLLNHLIGAQQQRLSNRENEARSSRCLWARHVPFRAGYASGTAALLAVLDTPDPGDRDAARPDPRVRSVRRNGDRLSGRLPGGALWLRGYRAPEEVRSDVAATTCRAARGAILRRGSCDAALRVQARIRRPRRVFRTLMRWRPRWLPGARVRLRCHPARRSGR